MVKFTREELQAIKRIADISSTRSIKLDHIHLMNQIITKCHDLITEQSSCEQRAAKIITNGAPEWLDYDTMSMAKRYWNLHTKPDDGFAIKAVMFIISRASDAGYKITASKGLEILREHCL